MAREQAQRHVQRSELERLEQCVYMPLSTWFHGYHPTECETYSDMDMWDDYEDEEECAYRDDWFEAINPGDDPLTQVAFMIEESLGEQVFERVPWHDNRTLRVSFLEAARVAA